MTTEWKDITDEMMMREAQATPREELERQIMSSLVPKNEREHWAASEIKSLREQLASRDAEVAELKKTIAFQKAAWTADYEECDQLRQQLAAAQARIDELMLEYFPDEMTREQLDNWAKHQVPTEPKE